MTKIQMKPVFPYRQGQRLWCSDCDCWCPAEKSFHDPAVYDAFYCLEHAAKRLGEPDALEQLKQSSLSNQQMQARYDALSN